MSSDCSCDADARGSADHAPGCPRRRPVNEPLEDVANRFVVGAASGGCVILALASRKLLSKQDALNLCAWLSVIADLDDEELLAARRQVEST
jgi:hypothetical protein